MKLVFVNSAVSKMSRGFYFFVAGLMIFEMDIPGLAVKISTNIENVIIV